MFTSTGDRAEQEHVAAQCLQEFLRSVPQSCNRHQPKDCSGDRAVVQQIEANADKQVSAITTGRNYLQKYLAWRCEPCCENVLQTFMQAKLESERFLQWAGPHDTTIVQVTPTATQIAGAAELFDAALINIFSASCKPLNYAAFLRGVRQRFRVRRFVARAQGPEGLFREDMPQTLRMTALDADDEAGKQGRFVFGSIVLVLVHRQLVHTEHAVFSVSRGPYKACADAGVPAPTYLTTRACITWAPGVDYEAVEEWWQDMMSRQAIRDPARMAAAASGPGLRFAGLKCPDASPRGLTAGVKLIRVALQQDAASLTQAIYNLDAEARGAELEAIMDTQLLCSFAPPGRSSDSDASSQT